MNLVALPALNDNYIWILHDGASALVVDPAVAEPVIAELQRLQLVLAAVLVTHHHADHTGGLDALYRALGNAQTRVYLPAADGIAPAVHASVPDDAITRCQGADCLQMLGTAVQVIDVPGHTAGHVAYYLPEPSPPLLFCGDTLFSGGCGRLFEGTAAQMHASLSALAALPPRTQVCCAHEYTLSNLRFAQAVEHGNTELQTYTRQCEDMLASRRCTLPSTVGQELAINPFLRTHVPQVQASARQHDPAAHDPIAVFAALREWKNHF